MHTLLQSLSGTANHCTLTVTCGCILPNKHVWRIVSSISSHMQSLWESKECSLKGVVDTESFIKILSESQGHNQWPGLIDQCLGCSDHEMVEVRMLWAGRKVKSKHIALGFRGADSGILKNLLGRAPRHRVLEVRGAQQSWLQETCLIWKDCLLQGLEQCLPTKRSQPKLPGGLQQINKKLLVKLKHKKEAYGGWKQGQVRWNTKTLSKQFHRPQGWN